MPKPVLSFKLLACCWGGVALLAASGAVALQLTEPGPAPVIVAAPALGVTTPVAAATLPFAATPAVTATPLPATTPMPFRNSSLLALLTPPSDRLAEHPAHPAVHAALAPSLPLPLPPIPPVQHVARVEPRRPAPVYAAEPQPAYQDWGRPMPYPGQFASARPYQYGAPPAYYGWQPYY